MFHVKNKFNLHGFSMMDIILSQEEESLIRKSTNSVLFFNELNIKYDNKWRHPLVIELKEKIENEYNVKLEASLLSLYNDGNDHTLFISDILESKGLFILSFGHKRILSTEKENKIKNKIVINDGDMLFFNYNSKQKYSIPKIEKLKDKTLILVFFVK